MPLVIIELLLALGFVLHGVGIAADGIGHLIDAISNAVWLHAAWNTVAGWFGSASDMQPQVGLANEALYMQFQQLMDTQFQAGELKRIILTMPAQPDEGY